MYFKRIFTLFVIALAINACTEQSPVEPVEPKFVQVAIPDVFKYGSNGRTSSAELDIVELDVVVVQEDGTETEGKIRVTMPPTEEEALVSFEMTNNIFEETGISPDFWLALQTEDGDSANGRIAASSCTRQCHDDYTDSEGNKIAGRGDCKALCWVKSAGKLLLLATIIINAT